MYMVGDHRGGERNQSEGDDNNDNNSVSSSASTIKECGGLCSGNNVNRPSGRNNDDDTIIGSDGFVHRLKQQSTNKGGKQVGIW
jgi:hypothetical protein